MRPLDYIKWRLNKNHGMLKNVAIIFFMTLIANLFSSLFFFYLGRRLGPEQYGEFGSLMALFFSFYFITTVIGVIIIRYLSYFQAKSQIGKISYLILSSKRRWFQIGGALFLGIAVFSYPLSIFLGIGFWNIILAGFTIWAFSLYMNNMSILNGLQRFKLLGWFKVLDAVIALGTVLILLEVFFLKRFGLGVEGALVSIIIAALMVLFVSNRHIAPYLKAQKMKIGNIGMRDYITKSIIFSLALGVIVNVDVFMVKFLFPRLSASVMANPELQVGWYAAASVIAKSAFFISLGIMTVSFPKVSELHANGKNPIRLFRSGIKYVLFSSFPMALFFLLLPNFVSKVLYGTSYQMGSFLGLYGLSMAFLSLANIMFTYKLAIKDYKALPALVGFAVLLVVLIGLFHNSPLIVVIDVLIITVLLLALSVYLSRQELKEAFFSNLNLPRKSISWFRLRR